MSSSACVAQHMEQVRHMWYPTSPTYRTVCYYTRWSKDRPGKGRFLPENIDAFLCTHIIFAFAKLEDSQISYFHWEDEEMSARLIGLKKSNPHLKILLSVGGKDAGSAQFTLMVNNSSTRGTFISSATTFLRERHFDGLDINWEHPARYGSPAADKYKFVSLMQELRSSFEREASTSGLERLLLTGAFPKDYGELSDGYDLQPLAAVMDFISIMTYDFHGPWSQHLGYNSPLQRSAFDHQFAIGNVRWVSGYYWERLDDDLCSKLNLGIPTFGRGFQVNSPNYHNPGVYVREASAPGPFTQTSGLLSYYEICDVRKTLDPYYDYQAFDPVVRNPFLTYDHRYSWVGFENQQSVKEKACHAIDRDFGGLMFWDLSMDDFSGESCGQCPYPLIWAGNSALHDPSVLCD